MTKSTRTPAMADRVKLTEVGLSFLSLLAEHPHGLVGPPPEYQGDLVHVGGPELKVLLERKMVGRRALAHPRDGETHMAKPPYLRITHRYKILKAGRALLASKGR